MCYLTRIVQQWRNMCISPVMFPVFLFVIKFAFPFLAGKQGFPNTLAQLPVLAISAQYPRCASNDFI